MNEIDDRDQSQYERIDSLSKKERRVLGTLIEKSLTTPEYYPLTLKALTNGCNQKSNRAPLSSYDEYDVEEILETLRSRGLIAAVQTAGGRSERYRHLLRDKLGWKNASLAIMGELLLRGRQQLGELRSRASRMSEIASLDLLRSELQQLMQAGYVQTSGDLHRRGIEVDHALYSESEQNKLAGLQRYVSEEQPVSADMNSDINDITSVGQPEQRPQSEALPVAQGIGESYREEIEELKEKVESLEQRIMELERQLGV